MLNAPKLYLWDEEVEGGLTSIDREEELILQHCKVGTKLLRKNVGCD